MAWLSVIWHDDMTWLSVILNYKLDIAILLSAKKSQRI